MENLNTSYLSSDDSSKPSQPLSLNTNNAPRYNSFLRTQSPADEKSFKKKVLHHSQSTAITPISSITSISSSVSLKPSLPPGGNTLSLNFSKKELTKLPRVILDYAPSLLVLDLSKNQFTNFPEELFKIQRLKTLKMESNYLKRIPNEIYQLSQLENLSFASNYIVSIPKTISKLAKTLQSLNVSNNHIEVLPKELTELVNLKALYIQRNFFTALPIQFDSLISLKELSLEWFKYTNPPLAVHQNDKNRSNIIKLFQLCKTLQSFSKTEVNFEDFINHFSLSNENIFAIRDPLNRNLLHITTIEQEIGIIHYLAANKPFFLHELDQDGQTPLNLAVREEKYFLARILLFHGADPNLGGGTVGSALHMVTIKHQLGMVRELLKHGANPKIGDLEGNTPLHLLFSTFSKDMNVSKDIAQALLDAGADPNQPNNDLWTPLHLAIRRGQTDCVKWVVQNNINNKDKIDKIFDLDAKGGSDEWTPLHLASSLSQYEIMNILFDNEVKLMSRTKTGRTAREVSMNHPIIMKILNKMEQRWMENNIFKASVSSTKEDGNLKDITAISNIENIAPNRESVKRTEGKPKAHGSLSGSKSRSSKSIGFRPALSTQLSKGSLKLDMQAKLKKDLRDKRDRKNYEEESDFREKKDAFSRYGMDDVKDDSLIVGDIDEIVGPKEITRVMPKSPNNIQKLQIAQNYRNHLLSLLPEKDLSRENVTRENEPHYGSFAGSRTIDNGFATLTNKQKQKMDVASQHFLFPNEFSKYIRKFENYNDEIKVFQNNILKNDDFEMPLCEKLKFLFYMKIIHMKLNKKIGRLNSELIPFELFIICESIEDELKKTAFNIPKKGVSHNNQDIILRSLLFIFENLETKDSNRNIVIKATISQMFGEFKYNSARHFLQQVLENSQENKYLRKEARSSLKLLHGMSTSQVLRNNFMKDKPASLMLGSPKNEFFSQPLTKIVKASFLSPTGTSTIATAVSKHKRPMSYYGKCENVGEEEEGLGHRKTMQQALQKKIIKESMDNEDIVNDSHESPIRTKTFPRPLAEKNSHIDRPRQIEIRGLAPKVGVDGYFSQF